MGEGVRVAVIPGDGIVVRSGDTVVVVGVGASTSPELIDRLLGAIDTGDGPERVRRLARLVIAADEPPPLAVATIGDDTASVFLLGAFDLVAPDGRETGAADVLGHEMQVPVAAGFSIVASGAEPPILPRWNDLAGGSTAGAGVVVTAIAAAPADGYENGTGGLPPPTVPDARPAESPTVAPPEADAARAFTSISLSDPIELADREPLPIADEEAGDQPDDDDDRPPYARTVQVVGTFSPRGYFNHPDAKYCSRTGVKMGASQTKILVEGPRPPLGVVTLDDGSTLTVQWRTVIGRDPGNHELVQREDAAPFVVNDTAQSVSRAHALLELSDWDVLVSDLGSRNGTYVQIGDDAPRRLATGERFVLHSGTVVHLGERTFVFHEHHVR